MSNTKPTSPTALPRTIYLLNQTNQAARTCLEVNLRELKLTGLQYTIMTIIRARPGISSAQLSRRFFVSPQTMNEIVTGLEKRGLLQRETSDQNRRVLVTRLTDEGQALLAQCDSIANRVEALAFDALNAEELNALRGLLRRLMQHHRDTGLGKSLLD